jgi:transcriptional regulator with XRE-family HTH domain
MIAVGEYLQQQRKASGLTQRDVAEELGVVDRTVSDWEAGRYSPSFDLMVRFVRLINGRIEEVIRLLFDDKGADRRAEFEVLAASLSDVELDAAIQAIRELRADPRRHDRLVDRAAPAPPPKRIRRRQGPGQS